MAQRMMFPVPLATIGRSAGTWTHVLTTNEETLVKAAADETPILFFTVPLPAETPPPHERTIKFIDFYYEVATAALEAAPVAVIRRKELAAGAVSTLTTETETEAITGDDTTGTAAGQYRLRITPATQIRADDDELIQVEVTINAAATTVLRIRAVTVTLA
jgi:hypothetical protein